MEAKSVPKFFPTSGLKPPSPFGDSFAIRHPGQIPRPVRRSFNEDGSGIRNFLIFCYFPGFPFDFAQGGEPIEPRISPTIFGLARNDRFVELQYSLLRERVGVRGERALGSSGLS